MNGTITRCGPLSFSICVCVGLHGDKIQCFNNSEYTFHSQVYISRGPAGVPVDDVITQSPHREPEINEITITHILRSGLTRGVIKSRSSIINRSVFKSSFFLALLFLSFIFWASFFRFYFLFYLYRLPSVR